MDSSKRLAVMYSRQTLPLKPADTELTMGQAAAILGVSRPYLIGRLEAGDLPFHKVGPSLHPFVRHHRVQGDHGSGTEGGPR